MDWSQVRGSGTITGAIDTDLRESLSQDEDPHGVRKLLALLRAQQDPTKNGSSSSTSSSSLPLKLQPTQVEKQIDSPTTLEDVRYISFAQALPHLTRLSKDDEFLSALLKLKDEQDRYEEMLANERIIFSKNKGSDISSNAALTSWDKEALRRWDMLHQEQQKKLQAWQVPCFFETRDPAQLKKQERVFDVLHGLLE